MAVERTILSLFEVTSDIRSVLSEKYKNSFWVKAEMNKLNHYSQSGHCYPELVEKKDGKIIAQIKSNLWREDYQSANQKFLRVLHEPLRDGVKILFLAKVQFDPLYGLSLRILDIDPSYTLGDLEREKQETIDQLKAEGIFNSNKIIPLTLLPQRIAIISVETSKGYVDFLHVLNNNPRNYHFFHYLFPSLLQGDSAVDAIIKQLNRIKKVKDHFDVVAIVRGGGGDIGLSCYNNYRLAKEIALFPMPIITGIGHATNETVVEMISYSNAITPTKIAEFLIRKFNEFYEPVRDAEEIIVRCSTEILQQQKSIFQSEIKLFRSVTENVLLENSSQLKSSSNILQYKSTFIVKAENSALSSTQISLRKNIFSFQESNRQRIKQLVLNFKKDALGQIQQSRFRLFQLQGSIPEKVFSFVRNETDRLNAIKKNVTNLSPENILKRGFSITLKNGKAVKSIYDVGPGDSIETLVSDGKINSEVKSAKFEKDDE